MVENFWTLANMTGVKARDSSGCRGIYSQVRKNLTSVLLL